MHSVLITAGGTGGHVIPGLCVAERLGLNGVNVKWLGTNAGVESKLVPQAGIPLYSIPVKKIRGENIFSKLYSVILLFLSWLRSFYILFKVRPSAVLGFGGYVSGPSCIAAWALKIPVIIHDQNAVPGITNKWLAKIANITLEGYKNSFPNNVKAIYVGNPVRKEFIDMPSPKSRLAERSGPIRLLIMGGSRGARTLNRVLPSALASLRNDFPVEVVHQAGKEDVEWVESQYKEGGINAKVVSYINDVVDCYAFSDLVIARSGAMTVSEISAVGMASILIPFPYAVDDHQTKNTRQLEKSNATIILQEEDLDEKTLSKILCGLNREKLLSMSVAAREQSKLNATQLVVDECMKIISGNGVV